MSDTSAYSGNLFLNLVNNMSFKLSWNRVTFVLRLLETFVAS